MLTTILMLQTLKTLSLHNESVEGKGAIALAEALKINDVRYKLCHRCLIEFIVYFIRTDAFIYRNYLE